MHFRSSKSKQLSTIKIEILVAISSFSQDAECIRFVILFLFNLFSRLITSESLWENKKQQQQKQIRWKLILIIILSYFDFDIHIWMGKKRFFSIRTIKFYFNFYYTKLQLCCFFFFFRVIVKRSYLAESYRVVCKKAMATSSRTTRSLLALATTTYTCTIVTCHRAFMCALWPKKERSNAFKTRQISRQRELLK